MDGQNTVQSALLPIHKHISKTEALVQRLTASKSLKTQVRVSLDCCYLSRTQNLRAAVKLA